ncbi:MAG: hypothetical protein RRZ24_11360 [Clostridia bacterium]
MEEIDENYLIVCDEMLRKRNRNELTYNCLHHYQNQTQHHIEFEYFPFIEDSSDFMILMDFEHPGMFKGRKFDPSLLSHVDLICKRQNLTTVPICVGLPSGATEEYQAQKEKLFNSIGSKDPDTIPRALHIWCGKYKSCFIGDKLKFVARNNRFKRSNVLTYKDITGTGEYIVVDFPHARIKFNDFLKVSGIERIKYMTTSLSVDQYYAEALTDWIGRLGEFYASTSVCE